MEWIKCSDRLPEKETMVLTYSPETNLRWGMIAFHGAWEVAIEGMETVSGITHWMPLPQPPKEESDNDQAKE